MVLVKFNVGDIVPQTGFYRIVNKKGKTLNQVLLNKGERFPLLTEEKCFYVLDF